MATLTAQGAPIEGEAGLGYVLKGGFFLPPLMLTEDELDAVILGLRFVSRRGDGSLRSAARDASAKLAAVLPPEMRETAAVSGLLAGPSARAEGPLVAAIRHAMRTEEKLRLAYVDKAGRSSERVIWPVALGFFDAVELVAAWCEMRNEFRHFRLDRIISIETTAIRYPKRRRVLLADWRFQEDLKDAF
jgi:predicted DNA-binding transcriptional regulator YafY